MVIFCFNLWVKHFGVQKFCPSNSGQTIGSHFSFLPTLENNPRHHLSWFFGFSGDRSHILKQRSFACDILRPGFSLGQTFQPKSLTPGVKQEFSPRLSCRLVWCLPIPWLQTPRGTWACEAAISMSSFGFKEGLNWRALILRITQHMSLDVFHCFSMWLITSGCYHLDRAKGPQMTVRASLSPASFPQHRGHSVLHQCHSP